jgi:hypothetical protein
MPRSGERKLDELAFLLALGALGLLALWFARRGTDTAVVMCGFCLAGIAAGWLVGTRGRILLPVAAGLAVVLYIGWVHPPGGPLRTSFMTHVVAGALVGWAAAETLRRRLLWPGWGIAALLLVALLALAWEVTEYVGDRVLDTALVPNRQDATLDVIWALLAGAAAIAFVRALDPLRGSAAR